LEDDNLSAPAATRDDTDVEILLAAALAADIAVARPGATASVKISMIKR
jgi:hypothetical protein